MDSIISVFMFFFIEVPARCNRWLPGMDTWTRVTRTASKMLEKSHLIRPCYC